MVLQKEAHDQERANFLKTVRNAVRTAKNIEADTELNVILPAAEKEWNDRYQSGELLDPLDILATIQRRIERGRVLDA